MSIGYACLALCIPDTDFRNCMMKNANTENLTALIAHNLNALENLIDANIERGIRLFRITSDLIPFGSSPVNTLAWRELFSNRFEEIGKKIKSGGVRVSMHPGQYTVLNSPHEDVVRRAIADLEYHARVLDCLGVDCSHKIILHIGGAYKDKPSAIKRFVDTAQSLLPHVFNRLAIENDDVSFHVGDVLEVSALLGLPVVFDTLHHSVNPHLPEKPAAFWMEACGATWKPCDGRQKIHYSQQNPGKKPGAHSESIEILPFLDFYRGYQNQQIDVMLEVKDKNISAVKCQMCTSPPKNPGFLEREWSRYKYLVMEHSPAIYNQIKQMMHFGSVNPVAFYRLTEEALAIPLEPGRQINAAEHVWGYFKGMTTLGEQTKFRTCVEKLSDGEPLSCKRHLHNLAKKYQNSYLLHSYYFSSAI